LAFLPGEPNRKFREISRLLFFFSFLLLFLRWRFSPQREDFVECDQSRIVCFCREISCVEF